MSGGELVLDTSFPSLEIIGAPQNTRVLEGEIPHPETGLPMRMYDTRTFDRVAQEQHSINEIELLATDGSITMCRYIKGIEPGQPQEKST